MLSNLFTSEGAQPNESLAKKTQRSSDENAIEISDLSKSYQIYDKPRDRLLQMIARGRKQYFREFWALKGISFTVKRGETVGIIGRNGAGKSTLLQLICGTVNPTAGNIHIRGRVAALLELGAGFNPEFTGRENVYLAASLYGLSKTEIDSRFSEIVAFADIGQFIEQPVKTYSSGMYVRLAFSVIAHVSADILIIDEALAVGDAYFQQKCMRLLRNFQSSGGTILFVSHDIGSVTALCQNALYLSNAGNGEYSYGPAESICKAYLNAVYEKKEQEDPPQAVRIASEAGTSSLRNSKNDKSKYSGESADDNLIKVGSFRADAEEFGKGNGRILNAWFEDDHGDRIEFISSGTYVNLLIEAIAYHDIQMPAIGFMLKDRLGQYLIAESSDVYFRKTRPSLNAEETLKVRFRFRMPELISGDYAFNLAFADGIGDDHIQVHWLYDALAITVVKSRLVHGICGLIDLTVELKIDRNEAEQEHDEAG